MAKRGSLPALSGTAVQKLCRVTLGDGLLPALAGEGSLGWEGVGVGVGCFSGCLQVALFLLVEEGAQPGSSGSQAAEKAGHGDRSGGGWLPALPFLVFRHRCSAPGPRDPAGVHSGLSSCWESQRGSHGGRTPGGRLGCP